MRARGKNVRGIVQNGLKVKERGGDLNQALLRERCGPLQAEYDLGYQS